jgi:hypothetical protein
LEKSDFLLRKGGHRHAFDAVAEFSMDSTATRANEDAVRRINVYGTLLTAVGTFFVAWAAH